MFRLTVSRALCPLAAVAVIASSRNSNNQHKPRNFRMLNVAHCENRLPKVDLALPKCEPSRVEEVTMPDGAKYVGELQDGKRWGKGECWDKSGHYAGSWMDNVKCGMGMFKYHDGSVYEGIFDNDLPNGYGKMTLKDGNVFEGEFVNGALPGLPRILIFPWGRYEGDVLDGLPHGYGREIYDNGDLVEGYFCEGKACGQGKRIYSDGDVWEGEFANDQPVSVKITCSSGLVVEATYSDGGWNGLVRVSYPDGCCEESWYEVGVLHGGIRITFPNGCVIEKNYVQGVAHGMERIVHSNGSVRETEYVDGVPLTSKFTYTTPEGVVVTSLESTPTDEVMAHMHVTITFPDGKVATGMSKWGIS